MPNSIFKSTDLYKQHFIQRLQHMILLDETGVFILVLANAITKAEIYQQLSGPLKQRLNRHKQTLGKLDNTEKKLIPADDLAVFQVLSSINFDKLPLARVKNLNGWQLQFNPLRSLRPPRNSHQKITRIFQPFDNDSFNFNKPFLTKEIFWQGSLQNINFRLLYNKFPFADFHGLLVIQPDLQKPQFLQQTDCIKTECLLNELSSLEGLGFAYNSLGAYASINHQHWQVFLSEQEYPVELPQWTHNNGTNTYPVSVECFRNLAEAWPLIEHCQNSDCCFNLLVRPAKTYLVKRKKQGEYQHSSWTSGFAWSEIMGNIMTTQLEDYNQLNAHTIEQEFKLLAV